MEKIITIGVILFIFLFIFKAHLWFDIQEVLIYLILLFGFIFVEEIIGGALRRRERFIEHIDERLRGLESFSKRDFKDMKKEIKSIREEINDFLLCITQNICRDDDTKVK